MHHRVGRIVIIDNVLLGPDGTGGERQGARLRRRARVPAPERRGEPEAQVQVGDEILAAGREEAAFPQPPLEPLEGAIRLVDLDRVAAFRHLRPPRTATVPAAWPTPTACLDPPFITHPSV